jgi:hypothetical protein
MSKDWEVTVITDSGFFKKVRVDNCITRQDAEATALGMTGGKRVAMSNPKTYNDEPEFETDYSYNQPYRQSSYDEVPSDFQAYMMTIGCVGIICWFLWIFSPVLSCLLAISFILFLIWCFNV